MLDVIMAFIFENILIIVGLGVVVYFLYYYLRIKRTSKLRPLNRNEYERLQFIERMKHNKTHLYKWFLRGNKTLGKIISFRKFTYSASPPMETIQLVIRPPLINIGKLTITNPFAKLQAFQVIEKKASKDTVKGTISVDEWVSFDYYFGIYYDMIAEREHTQLIKRDNVIRSDLNALASIYLVKAQEQSTFDPDHAHEMTKLEKQLQIELAKTKGKSEAI